MPDAKTINPQAMDALRRKYAERLREREVQINELVALARQQPLTPHERFTLQNHAHSLAGSGTTYGYPDITKAGRVLEESIEGGAAEAVFLPLTEELLTICSSVSSAQMPSQT